MIDTIVAGVVSYFLGVIVAAIIFQPGKTFDSGWEAARKVYSDYKRGFNEGIEASKHYFSYKKGFDEGWDCGWQRREEYYELFERSEE